MRLQADSHSKADTTEYDFNVRLEYLQDQVNAEKLDEWELYVHPYHSYHTYHAIPYYTILCARGMSPNKRVSCVLYIIMTSSSDSLPF